jgi:putative endonuclease
MKNFSNSVALFKTTSKQTGDAAEQVACTYLQNQGLKLLDQNYHGKFGELDLIMQDSDSIVFIEVRYRKKTSFGSPVESITYQKQQKLIKTALYYLQRHPKWQNAAARFDVVGITSQNDVVKDQIEWIQNAFNAE